MIIHSQMNTFAKKLKQEIFEKHLCPSLQHIKGLVFYLAFWPIDLNTNSDHLLIKDYLPLALSWMRVKGMSDGWQKKEDVEVDTLSKWIKSIADVVKRRIRRLEHSVNTRHESIFRDPDLFVCKRHYVNIWTIELGLNSLPGVLRIFLHQKCWTATNRSSLYKE